MENAINKFKNAILNNRIFSNPVDFTDLQVSGYAKTFIYFILCLFLFYFFIRVLRYKITVQVESLQRPENGLLLISEPVRFDSEPKLCQKNMQISSNGEHTYTFWIYVKNYNAESDLIDGEAGFIFFRQYENSLMSTILNYKESSLEIYMIDPKNTVDNINYQIYSVEIMRFQTWTHITISQWGRNMDVFINGKLTKSFIMDNDLVTTRLGKFKVIGSDFIQFGFSPIDGLISRFKYYSKKIAVHKIYKNYTDGPSNNNNSSVLSLKVADINI